MRPKDQSYYIDINTVYKYFSLLFKTKYLSVIYSVTIGTGVPLTNLYNKQRALLHLSTKAERDAPAEAALLCRAIAILNS